MACAIESVWNNRLLRPPPVISLPAPVIQQDKVKMVLKILKEMQEDKEKQDILSQEKFILSRIIYKLNAQLRSEKTLQCLKRIKVCLSKLTEMKIEKTVDDYLSILKESNLMARTPYLPSQQMTEHLLVRLMGARYLYRQTANFCSTAYVHLKQQLTIGTLVPQNLTLMALISRVWLLTRVCSQCCVQWYDSIYTCLATFPATTHRWLPEGSVLPSTIAEPEDESDESEICQSAIASCERSIKKDRDRKEKDSLFYGDNEEESEISTETNPQPKIHHEDSSKSKRESSFRVQSRIDSHQMESSEDEGEVISRNQQSFRSESCPQGLSEDEGQPVKRTGRVEISRSPGSSEDEGEPVSRYSLQQGDRPDKRMKVTEDEMGRMDGDSERTAIKMDNVVESVVDENIVQSSSFDELIQLLSNVNMASQEEACLVKTSVDALRKLKGESVKKGQKKKLKQARKLVIKLNADLAHIRATCHQKVHKKVKMNKPSRSKNEAMNMTETKAGKKRIRDLDQNELDTIKKKKSKLSPKSNEQNGTRVSDSSEDKEGVLDMIKLWQGDLHKSSEVTLKGLKYDLGDNAKKRFGKKLKFIKRKFLNGDLSEKDSLDAIQSFLSSV